MAANYDHHYCFTGFICLLLLGCSALLYTTIVNDNEYNSLAENNCDVTNIIYDCPYGMMVVNITSEDNVIFDAYTDIEKCNTYFELASTKKQIICYIKQDGVISKPGFDRDVFTNKLNQIMASIVIVISIAFLIFHYCWISNMDNIQRKYFTNTQN